MNFVGERSEDLLVESSKLEECLMSKCFVGHKPHHNVGYRT